MRLVLTIFSALLLWTAANSYESGTARRSYPETTVLWFSDLPDAWTLEASTDLTNWYSVISAGEIPPREFSMTLTNERQSQFYRMRIEQP